MTKSSVRSGAAVCRTSMMALSLVAAVVSGQAWAEVTVDGKNVSVSGAGAFAADADEVQVSLTADADLQLVPTDYAVTLCSSGGAVSVVGSLPPERWQDKVCLWLDASCAESLGWESNKATGATCTTTDQDGVTRPTIDFWYDRRPEQRTWFGYNNRGLNNTPSGTYPSVMPYVVTNGCNGTNCVSFGKLASWGRRLPFVTLNADGSINCGVCGDAAPKAIPAKLVMMVFGSQRGGGRAVISGMPRASQTDVTAATGVFASQRTTWIDGEPVADVTTTGLCGGWQILSFETPVDVVKGIGYASWGADNHTNGGQDYAEILVFTNMPTAIERQSAERYLAKKWGISGYPELTGDVRLFGTGSAQVAEGCLCLGGSFDGTLTVCAGATVSFTDAQTAPARPDWIEQGKEDTLWYDTDRSDLSTYTTLDGAVEPNHSLNKLLNLANQSHYPLFGAARGAFYVDEARGMGPIRRWFDYRKSLSGGSSVPGNTSRFKDSNSATGNTFDTRTGFMVLDTSAGGGTPFLDTSVYSDSTRYLTARVSASSPIFTVRSGHESLTNTPAYLNGVAVESGKHAFNARPEVLSFGFDEAVPIKCLGYYAQYNDTFELRHGEVILTSKTLTDAQRRATEAYLMKKWIGLTPEGYGDASKTVVSGAGAVKLARHLTAQPKFDAAYSGTVSASTGALVFAVNASDGSVVNALSLGAGTFDAGESLTVDVTIDGRIAGGRYKLISAAAWTGAEPTLGTVVQSVPRRCTFAFERTGGDLYLTVTPPGALLIIR